MEGENRAAPLSMWPYAYDVRDCVFRYHVDSVLSICGDSSHVILNRFYLHAASLAQLKCWTFLLILLEVAHNNASHLVGMQLSAVAETDRAYLPRLVNDAAARRQVPGRAVGTQGLQMVAQRTEYHARLAKGGSAREVYFLC